MVEGIVALVREQSTESGGESRAERLSLLESLFSSAQGALPESFLAGTNKHGQHGGPSPAMFWLHVHPVSQVSGCWCSGVGYSLHSPHFWPPHPHAPGVRPSYQLSQDTRVIEIDGLDTVEYISHLNRRVLLALNVRSPVTPTRHTSSSHHHLTGPLPPTAVRSEGLSQPLRR